MIPQALIESLRALLGDETPALLDALNGPPVRGLRLTPAIPSGPLPDTLDEVPWYPGMLYLTSDSEAGKAPLHEAGAYYLQEPSAAAPPRVLAPQPGELVLDLCAAPGGKATALAQLAPSATVIANEIVPDRARTLSANAERLGCRNVVVLNEAPERLATKWPDLFDAVLVDAPCSGEGMFRRHPEAAQEWTPDTPAGCARRQQAILDAAAQLVRPGGRLCYSTCTFNRLENEAQVEAFLQRQPAFEPVPFTLPGVGPAPDGTLRLWPHRVRGEGHFVALLRRRGEGAPAAPADHGGLPAPDRAARKAAEALLAGLLATPLTADAAFGDGIWQVPPRCPDLRGMRVLRPGLKLTRAQRSTLLPDHALSHAIPSRLRLSLTEEETRRFLHGEALPSSADASGWCQVCTGDAALGWGKLTQGIIKNHYPKGLRK